MKVQDAGMFSVDIVKSLTDQLRVLQPMRGRFQCGLVVFDARVVSIDGIPAPSDKDLQELRSLKGLAK